jgi:hypothetical protein
MFMKQMYWDTRNKGLAFTHPLNYYIIGNKNIFFPYANVCYQILGIKVTLDAMK